MEMFSIKKQEIYPLQTMILTPVLRPFLCQNQFWSNAQARGFRKLLAGHVWEYRADMICDVNIVGQYNDIYIYISGWWFQTFFIYVL